MPSTRVNMQKKNRAMQGCGRREGGGRFGRADCASVARQSRKTKLRRPHITSLHHPRLAPTRTLNLCTRTKSISTSIHSSDLPLATRELSRAHSPNPLLVAHPRLALTATLHAFRPRVQPAPQSCQRTQEYMYSRQRYAFRVEPPPKLQKFRCMRIPSSIIHQTNG